jgi:hypothetical protein
VLVRLNSYAIEGAVMDTEARKPEYMVYESGSFLYESGLSFLQP